MCTLILCIRKTPNFMTLHFKTPLTQFVVCLTEPGAGLFCPSVHWVLRRLRSTWLRRCTRLVCRVAEVFNPFHNEMPNFITLHIKTPPTRFRGWLTKPGVGLFCPSVHWVLRRLRSTWLRRCTRLVCRVAEVFDPLQKGEAKLLDSLLWLPGFFLSFLVCSQSSQVRLLTTYLVPALA